MITDKRIDRMTDEIMLEMQKQNERKMRNARNRNYEVTVVDKRDDAYGACYEVKARTRSEAMKLARARWHRDAKANGLKLTPVILSCQTF